MFQNLNWSIPFIIGFLSAVIIWIGLGTIRFWIDIRKTKKAILDNDLIAEDNEPLRSAMNLITNSQNSLRMTCLLYTSPSPRDRGGSRLQSCG